MPIRSHLPTFVYAACLLLASACFYFSISEGVFSWLFPDELVPYNAYVGRGLFGCTKYYYLDTTVNRLSADFGICAMAGISTWFGPYLGWAVARLAVYALIPLCLALLFKELLSVPYRLGLIAALLISSAAFFMNSQADFYMFGLDLAIYGTLTFTFFLLFAWFPRALQSRRGFLWFCFFFALNLTSHEICLVLSGFFIPLYAWQRYSAMPNADWKKPPLLILKEILAIKEVRISNSN